MRLSSLILVCALTGLAGCGESPVPEQAGAPPAPAAAAPSTQVYATSRQIMLGLVIPASDAIWAGASEAPADDAAWERLQSMALMIAESGQLMMTAPRVVDQGDWLAFTQGMIDASVAAAQAAQQKNLDAFADAGDVLYESCDTCHAKYMAARQGQ